MRECEKQSSSKIAQESGRTYCVFEQQPRSLKHNFLLATEGTLYRCVLSWLTFFSWWDGGRGLRGGWFGRSWSGCRHWTQTPRKHNEVINHDRRASRSYLSRFMFPNHFLALDLYRKKDISCAKATVTHAVGQNFLSTFCPYFYLCFHPHAGDSKRFGALYLTRRNSPRVRYDSVPSQLPDRGLCQTRV